MLFNIKKEKLKETLPDRKAADASMVERALERRFPRKHRDGVIVAAVGFGADVRRPVGDYASSASGLRLV